VWVTSSLETALTPTAVALGNFDGVHRGHKQVIQPVWQTSKSRQPLTVAPTLSEWQPQFEDAALSVSMEGGESMGMATNHTYATVVTFNPHPQEFFSGQMRKLLTPQDEKVQQLRSLGIEQLVLLPFDRELADLSPQEFVLKILVQQLQARRISVGRDFCFGHRRSGTSADLQAIAASYGIEVDIVSLQLCQGERISSSCIRQSLSQGDLERANRLLGRPYSLRGLVVKGQQLGRTLGFPTANLQLPSEKFLPRQGVYCVRVWYSNLATSVSFIPGVMNIGKRPTVDGTIATVEVHLLDWSGDLYGQTVTVSLEKFLRPEQKFASLDALKAQIQLDSQVARAFFSDWNHTNNL
jgi:riboflavin kinase/FMN adenylyltransferase